MPAPKLDQISALLDALVTTPSIAEAARRCFEDQSADLSIGAARRQLR